MVTEPTGQNFRRGDSYLLLNPLLAIVLVNGRLFREGHGR
jgi:hypothetical protein